MTGSAVPFRVTIRLPATPIATLPVAQIRPDKSHLLVDGTGKPVWPVKSDEEHAMLSSAVSVFNSALEPCVASEAVPTDAHPFGQVVGIGDVRFAAQLYAHLTNRTWCVVKTVDELASRPAPEVVLTSTLRLDPMLVEFLFHAPNGDTKTGIIWGRTEDELTRLVIMRSAASVLCGPLTDRRVDIDCVSGRDTDLRSISDRLKKNAGVLTIVAHGDTYSLRLSPRMALCAMDAPAEYGDPTLGPPCLATGVCEKVNLPVSTAVERGNIQVPENVSARVVVMASCLTAYVGSPALDSAWTHFARLVTNPRIGAMVASPESVTIIDTSISEDLTRELAEGLTVGKALADYDNSPTVQALGSRFLLFGDPRTRAAPGGQGHINRHRLTSHQRTRHREHEYEDVTNPEIGMLRRLASHMRPDMRHTASETSARAMQALSVYESAPEPVAPHVSREMRLAMLSHLATIKVNSEQAWLNYACMQRDETLSRCPRCGMRLRIYTARFASGYERRIVNCMRCYVVSDLPRGSNLEVDAELPRVQIRKPPLLDDWSAATFVVSGLASNTTMHLWPQGADGMPATASEIAPAQWPPGPLWVRFALIAGTTLHVVGLPARAPSKSPVAQIPADDSS